MLNRLKIQEEHVNQEIESESAMEEETSKQPPEL